MASLDGSNQHSRGTLYRLPLLLLRSPAWSKVISSAFGLERLPDPFSGRGLPPVPKIRSRGCTSHPAPSDRAGRLFRHRPTGGACRCSCNSMRWNSTLGNPNHLSADSPAGTAAPQPGGLYVEQIVENPWQAVPQVQESGTRVSYLFSMRFWPLRHGRARKESALCYFCREKFAMQLCEPIRETSRVSKSEGCRTGLGGPGGTLRADGIQQTEGPLKRQAVC